MENNPYQSPLAHGSKANRLPNRKSLAVFQGVVVFLNSAAAIYLIARRPPEWIGGACFLFCAIAVLATMRKKSPRLKPAPN